MCGALKQRRPLCSTMIYIGLLALGIIYYSMFKVKSTFYFSMNICLATQLTVICLLTKGC